MYCHCREHKVKFSQQENESKHDKTYLSHLPSIPPLLPLALSSTHASVITNSLWDKGTAHYYTSPFA